MYYTTDDKNWKPVSDNTSSGDNFTINKSFVVYEGETVRIKCESRIITADFFKKRPYVMKLKYTYKQTDNPDWNVNISGNLSTLTYADEY